METKGRVRNTKEVDPSDGVKQPTDTEVNIVRVKVELWDIYEAQLKHQSEFDRLERLKNERLKVLNSLRDELSKSV